MADNTAPTALDLCAGAGGLSLGLKRAGWSVLGVEHDADAVATHRSQVGPCDLADLREWHPQGRVKAVVGGVPCQTFSYAGFGEGTEDPRGQLYLEMLRIANEADADAFILENVRGLITRGLDKIRTDAEERGWLTRWALLDAADFGVPQHRRRVFLLGTRKAVRWTWPTPTHGPAGLLGLQPWVTVRQAVGIPYDRPAPTITGREHAAAGANLGSRGGVARARRAGDVMGCKLTLEQCAALQGFPAGFAFEGDIDARFLQVGNAVPPRLGEVVGRALLDALGDTSIAGEVCRG
jgi:DNA (cytosine-5)-methyltransferase 1